MAPAPLAGLLPLAPAPPATTNQDALEEPGPAATRALN